MPATAVRDPRYASPGEVEAAKALKVGDRVRFTGEKQARFKVRARGERYIVLTKPFNLTRPGYGKWHYTVIDLELGIRGTDDCVGSLGYESEEEIAHALELLETGDFEISIRNNVGLQIVDVKPAS